jgi:Mrp family chromosome partitioning ATPase/capsular polysaccharide biosynthesis protein
VDDRDVRQLLEPLKRSWWIVVLVALVISAVVYVHYRGVTPKYTAQTSVYVQPSSLEALLGGVAGFGDADRTVTNQALLLQTPAVATEAARELRFKGDPRQLLSLVKATPAENSDFIQIAATGSEPRFTADVANAFAAAFVQLGTRRWREDAAEARATIERELDSIEPRRENEDVRRDLQERLGALALVDAMPTRAARQVDRAAPPAEADGPEPVRNAIFAGMLGLVLGGLLAYGLRALDRRLSPSNVEAEYGMPLLASIPWDRKAAAQVRVGSQLPGSMVEPARTVRTTLDQGVRGGPAPRMILVTSAISGEGKSTFIKSLAVAFRESGRNVLVIDADLRAPVLHEFFGSRQEPGLAELLLSNHSHEFAVQDVVPNSESVQNAPVETGIEADLDDLVGSLEPESEIAKPPHTSALHTLELPLVDEADPGSWGRETVPSANGDGRAYPALHLLASGARPADPAALLSSEQMARLLEEVGDSYDVVLIDSPPLLAVSDAIPLSTAVDGVIAVTREDLTTRDDVQGFRRTLDRLPQVTVLGLVANGVRDLDVPRYYAGDA